jgi:hypothetical protein
VSRTGAPVGRPPAREDVCKRTVYTAACGANGTSKSLPSLVRLDIHCPGPTSARICPSCFVVSSTLTCWPGCIVPTARLLILASARTVALWTTVCDGDCISSTSRKVSTQQRTSCEPSLQVQLCAHNCSRAHTPSWHVMSSSARHFDIRHHMSSRHTARACRGRVRMVRGIDLLISYVAKGLSLYCPWLGLATGSRKRHDTTPCRGVGERWRRWRRCCCPPPGAWLAAAARYERVSPSGHAGARVWKGRWHC